jgi:GNAT superfamily N-acetyltransferase
MDHSYTIDLEVSAAPEDVQVIKKGLASYNSQKSGIGGAKELSVFLRNEEKTTVGGILGFTYGYWMHIQTFWVEENLKGNGYGSQLLEKAEKEAIKRGCRIVDLATFSFQAPEFYQKIRIRTIRGNGKCRR